MRGEVWTCAQPARVLEWELGISFCNSQVWRLLQSIGWTRHVPITRAFQRDEQAISAWRNRTWPALKRRAVTEGRKLGLPDESGFYLWPSRIKTHAPRRQTPALRVWQRRSHLSMMGAVTPAGHVSMLARAQAMNTWNTIAFLRHLQHWLGRRLLVILDRSPIHRNDVVREFVDQTHEIRLDMLPPTAPDLNPVEWMWRRFKLIELANVACMDVLELHGEFDFALRRLRQKPDVLRAFFDDAELKLTRTDCAQIVFVFQRLVKPPSSHRRTLQRARPASCALRASTRRRTSARCLRSTKRILPSVMIKSTTALRQPDCLSSLRGKVQLLTPLAPSFARSSASCGSVNTSD